MNAYPHDNLYEAIGKQRLLFLAISGLNAPGVNANLTDGEIVGLTSCISETINLLQEMIDATSARVA
jgi:hypothetical protein